MLPAGTWGAVGSMTLCVALLIASEFMPVSLLTPIAADLRATEGMAGQAISISGFFAVVTSLLIANVAGRYDGKRILVTLTAFMLASLILIAEAPNFVVLMLGRACLGVTIGGFWALSTATIMRIVPESAVPKALGLLYTGNAVATAFAAPLGSFLGNIIGWRGVFWGLTPFVICNLAWQWKSLPPLAPRGAIPVAALFGLLRRRDVIYGIVGVMGTFGGAFAVFTYLRPFLEGVTGVSVPQLSTLLLGLGLAGFLGTYIGTALVRRNLWAPLVGLPIALGIVNLGLLALGHSLWGVGVMMVLWGTINSAIPVTWSTWLARVIRDAPEAGGGLLIAAIQLEIMAGAALGGLLLDHISVAATFIGGTILLLLASVTIAYSRRTKPAPADLSGSMRRA